MMPGATRLSIPIDARRGAGANALDRVARRAGVHRSRSRCAPVPAATAIGERSC